jgi:hypothetical protein
MPVALIPSIEVATRLLESCETSGKYERRTRVCCFLGENTPALSSNRITRLSFCRQTGRWRTITPQITLLCRVGFLFLTGTTIRSETVPAQRRFNRPWRPRTDLANFVFEPKFSAQQGNGTNRKCQNRRKFRALPTSSPALGHRNRSF